MDVIWTILVSIIGIDLTVLSIALPIAIHLDLRDRSVNRQRTFWRRYVPAQFVAGMIAIGFWALVMRWL